MRVDDYLRLLDWTGRQIRDDKPGAIPNRLAPILDRLALTDGTLLEAIGQFGKSFRRCVGAGEKVDAKAAEAGKQLVSGRNRPAARLSADSARARARAERFEEEGRSFEPNRL